MTVDKAALRALAETLNGILLPEGYNRQALKDAAVALPALLDENEALRTHLSQTASMLQSTCLVISDPEARAMALQQVRDARAVLNPAAPPQGDGA